MSFGKLDWVFAAALACTATFAIASQAQTYYALTPVVPAIQMGSGVVDALGNAANGNGGVVTWPVGGASLAAGAAAANLGFTPLIPANNLSDVSSIAAAQTNLGLSAIATTMPGTGVAAALGKAANSSGGLVTSPIGSASLASGAAAANLGFTPLSPANNLSDLSSAATAQTNLGLSALATTTPGMGVAAALSNAANSNGGVVIAPIASASLASGAAAANLGFTPLSPANNLSDLSSAVTAQTNLGLSALATTMPGAGVAAALSNAANSSGGVVTSPLRGSNATFSPPGQPPITLQQRGLFQVFVGDYGASGSSTQGNGSISAGSATLNLLNAEDFANGQGVLIPGAGSIPSLSVPIVTYNVVGPPGSTVINYYVALLDAHGGIGPAQPVAVTTAPATITASNYVTLGVTIPGGALGYIVWKNGGNYSAETYFASSDAATFYDNGVLSNAQSSASGVLYKPWWVPATHTTSAQNDWCIQQIFGGGGTTTLTLASACANAQSGATVRHDDTAAFNNCLGSASQVACNVPCGTYNVTGSITFSATASNVGLIGSGRCSNIRWSGTQNLFSILGTSSSSPYGDSIRDMLVTATGNDALGYGVYGTFVEQGLFRNVIFDHPYAGVFLQNFGNIALENVFVTKLQGQDGYGVALTSDSLNRATAASLYNVYVTNGILGGVNTSQIGLYVDGNVQTVNAWNFGVGAGSGAGIQLSNNARNALAPQFFQCVSCSSEFTAGPAVNLLAGENISFSGSSIFATGSYKNYSSCSASPNVYIASGILQAEINGGLWSNAPGDGIFVNTSGFKIVNGTWFANSASNAGGVNQNCPAIELGPSSSGTQVGTNVIGTAAQNWQNQCVLIDNGANGFTVEGNTCTNNKVNHVVNNAGRTGSNVVNCNSGDINDCTTTLGQSGIPFIVAGAGTIGINGALTFANPLDNTYANAYIYMPSGAISSGSAAAWYYATCSSVTSCTLYNNIYSSGNPAIPSSPTAFSTNGPGAYTQSIGSNIGAYTLSIPASQLGPNDGLTVSVNASYANDANTKSVATAFGGNGFASASFTTSHSWAGIAGFRNRGSAGSQVTMLNNNNFGTGSSPGNLTTMSVNTATAQNLVVNAQLTNAVDYVVIQSVNVQFLPGIN